MKGIFINKPLTENKNPEILIYSCDVVCLYIIYSSKTINSISTATLSKYSQNFNIRHHLVSCFFFFLRNWVIWNVFRVKTMITSYHWTISTEMGDIRAFAIKKWRRKWQPTPVLLPRKSCGWRSLVGCCS